MDSNSNTSDWRVFGYKFSRSLGVFVSQTVILYVVIITSLINLTLGKDPHTLWTALLSSCLGYLLPAPNIKKAAIQLQHQP